MKKYTQERYKYPPKTSYLRTWLLSLLSSSEFTIVNIPDNGPVWMIWWSCTVSGNCHEWRSWHVEASLSFHNSSRPDIIWIVQRGAIATCTVATQTKMLSRKTLLQKKKKKIFIFALIAGHAALKSTTIQRKEGRNENLPKPLVHTFFFFNVPPIFLLPDLILMMFSTQETLS